MEERLSSEGEIFSQETTDGVEEIVDEEVTELEWERSSEDPIESQRKQ